MHFVSLVSGITSLHPNLLDCVRIAGGEIPNVGMKAEERLGSYSDRAFLSSKGSEEQKKYAKLAIAELDALIEFTPDKEAHKNQILMLFSKVSLISLTDQPEETIAATNEVFSRNDSHPGILELDEVESLKCAQAEAYVALGKWEEAGKIFKTLYNTYLQSGGHNALVRGPLALALMGLARTNYELGKYDEAVEIGSVAMKEFRQCPGVHKYVALSQKAKGDIDEAKKIMSRAILYEYHWDEDNLQKNKQILRELSGG